MTNLHNSHEEIWKDIPGFEGFYQASTLGRIRSLDRTFKGERLGKPCNVTKKGRILKPYPTRCKYLLVDIRDKTISAHRIIAITFLGPIPKGAIVMHKNNIKTDNRVCNLKYGTYSQNTIDAIKDRLYVHGRTGKHGRDNPQSKRVNQLDLLGNLIATFESTADAGRALNIPQSSISNTCLGRNKTSGGYKWEYPD